MCVMIIMLKQNSSVDIRNLGAQPCVLGKMIWKERKLKR